jgi:hypothetical protein
LRRRRSGRSRRRTCTLIGGVALLAYNRASAFDALSVHLVLGALVVTAGTVLVLRG